MAMLEFFGRKHRLRYLAALAAPVVLTAGLAGPAAAAAQPEPMPPDQAMYLENFGTLNAGTPTCLDADGGAVGNYNSISQWTPCSFADTFQQWQFVQIGYSPSVGAPIYQVQSVGASQVQTQNGGPPLCLDVDAQYVGDGGPIIQYDCSAWDPYQQWTIALGNPANGFAGWQLQNVGATQNAGFPVCLRAAPDQADAGGAVAQFTCDANDLYQQWLPDGGPVTISG